MRFTSFYELFGLGLGLSSGRNLRAVENATLTIKIYSDKNDKASLIWQGSTSQQLKSSSTSAKDYDALVEKSAALIMQTFPPQ